MGLALGFGLVKPSANVGSEGVSHILVDDREVKPVGIEMAAAPSLHLGVLGVERVGHDREESFVPGNAAHVLRRPRSGASETNRLPGLNIERQKLLDFDPVTPVVAEIVGVAELHVGFATKISELDVALIEQARAVFGRHVVDVGIAITKTSNTKLVKVRIPPIESRLDREVKLVKTPSQRHDQLSPNWRLDVVELNPKFDRVYFPVDHRVNLAPGRDGVNSFRQVNGEVESATRDSRAVGRRFS